MPILNVMCPNKHRPFSTGIEIAEEKKNSLPNRTTFSRCPYARGAMEHSYATIKACGEDSRVGGSVGVYKSGTFR